MSPIEPARSIAFAADQRVHGHRRDHVFPDGVVLGDVLDAIAAAGLADNYQLAHQFSIQYALDVCVRCARKHVDKSVYKDARTPLFEIGITSSWGSVCALCKLTLLANRNRVVVTKIL